MRLWESVGKLDIFSNFVGGGPLSEYRSVRGGCIYSVLVMAVVLAMVSFNVTGCASSRSSEVYSRDQARQAQTLVYGTVVAVKSVVIEGTKTSLGTSAGGVAGGVLGSTVGSGSGKTVAAVVGALAGAALGTAAEEGLTRKPGFELVVQKDTGDTIVVVQEADVPMAPGDRVKVITAADGTTRVAK